MAAAVAAAVAETPQAALTAEPTPAAVAALPGVEGPSLVAVRLAGAEPEQPVQPTRAVGPVAAVAAVAAAGKWL